MPDESRDQSPPAPVARATAARARAPARLADETRDLFLPEDARLDDRLRAALNARLRAVVGGVERELRLSAARRLTGMGARESAEALLARVDTVLRRLRHIPLLHDPVVMADLLGATRLALLARHLPPGASAGADRPSLVVRLAECPEPDVARAAGELLALTNEADEAELPEALRAKLPWWVAAALREELGDEARADHALADAAVALIADGRDKSSTDVAAMRLAEMIAARPDELAGLLVETLRDRRPALFVALLAVAAGLSFEEARDIVTDPDGARLWLLLRAQGLDRPVIARVGVALAAADGTRDLERFAEQIDEVMAVPSEVAAASFAPLALPSEYRRALDALERV